MIRLCFCFDLNQVRKAKEGKEVDDDAVCLDARISNKLILMRGFSFGQFFFSFHFYLHKVRLLLFFIR